MNAPTHVEVKDNIGWITIDLPPVNATSTAVRAGLLDAIKAVQDCSIAVIQCAGRTFVAGGDMSEFDAPPAEPHLPDVIDAIENSTTPIVALMHGTVLGGGFEIAMACAFRVAKPNTRFGLPEVNVGLIPGAGGTQRAPRLLGWNMAVDMACLGKMFDAQAMLDIGAIDAISETPEAEITRLVTTAHVPVSQREISPPTPDEIASYRTKVAKFAKGREAPGLNLDALLWAVDPYKTSQPKERALHLDLRNSDQSGALRHVFFAERSAAKPEQIKDASPNTITKIAIGGGGLMGSGIAAACLNGGYSVTVIERDDTAVKTAQANVTKLMQGALDRGKVTGEQFAARMAACRVTTDYKDCADADMAIEAVFEDLAAKRLVFENLSKHMAPTALLATNTSYLDPNEIFAKTPNRERCLGIHFFSPAHIMKLVEVIRADGTNNDTLSTAFKLTNKLRKTPVLSGVCDGFIGNRILAAYRRAAEYLLADGALPHEVDAAMRDFGMAMGPFEAQDMSGLQIGHANRRRQDANRAPSERYVTIADQLCDLERFGRRSGAGWYRYVDGKTPQRDPQVEALILAFATNADIKRKVFQPEDIQNQLMAAMANEGAKIVAEGIATDAATVDVVKTAGYGFPRWRGGPMHWAETVSKETVRDALNSLDTASPGSWVRASRFA